MKCISLKPVGRSRGQKSVVSRRVRTRHLMLVEQLEDRIALSGLLNGDFSISNPSDPNYGWSTQGDASIANGEGILDEGTSVQTQFSQSFTVAPGTTTLEFSIVASDLVNNGAASSPDAGGEASTRPGSTSIIPRSAHSSEWKSPGSPQHQPSLCRSILTSMPLPIASCMRRTPNNLTRNNRISARCSSWKHPPPARICFRAQRTTASRRLSTRATPPSIN